MPIEAELMSVSPVQHGEPRVPGAHLLGHQLRDAPGLVDDVVRGDLALRPRQPVDRACSGGNARVVQDEHVRQPAVTLARSEVRRGLQGVDQRGVGFADQSPRSLAMVS